MSAEIVKLDQRITPDMEKVIAVLNTTTGDFGEMYELAKLSLESIERARQEGELSPCRARGIVNSLAVACISIGTMLGHGEDVAAALLDA